MEPLLSTLTPTVRNVPHDLQARLYREIGVAAVAAALDVGHGSAADPVTLTHGYGTAERWMEPLPVSDEIVRAA